MRIGTAVTTAIECPQIARSEVASMASTASRRSMELSNSDGFETVRFEGVAASADTQKDVGSTSPRTATSNRGRRRERRRARRRRRRGRMKRFFKKIGKGLGKALSVVGKIGVYVGMAVNFVLPGVGTLISTASSVAAQVGHALQHGVKNIAEFLKMAGNVALDAVGSIPGVGQAVQTAVRVGKAARAAVKTVRNLVADGVKGIGNAVTSLASGALEALGAAVPDGVAATVRRVGSAVDSAVDIGVGVAEGDGLDAVLGEAEAWVGAELGQHGVLEGVLDGASLGGVTSAINYGTRAAGSIADIASGIRAGDGLDAALGEAEAWVGAELGQHGVLDGVLDGASLGGVTTAINYGTRAAGSIAGIASGIRAGDGLDAVLGEAEAWVGAELGQHGVIDSRVTGNLSAGLGQVLRARKVAETTVDRFASAFNIDPSIVAPPIADDMFAWIDEQIERSAPR